MQRPLWTQPRRHTRFRTSYPSSKLTRRRRRISSLVSSSSRTEGAKTDKGWGWGKLEKELSSVGSVSRPPLQSLTAGDRKTIIFVSELFLDKLQFQSGPESGERKLPKTIRGHVFRSLSKLADDTLIRPVFQIFPQFKVHSANLIGVLLLRKENGNPHPVTYPPGPVLCTPLHPQRITRHPDGSDGHQLGTAFCFYQISAKWLRTPKGAQGTEPSVPSCVSSDRLFRSRKVGHGPYPRQFCNRFVAWLGQHASVSLQFWVNRLYTLSRRRHIG